MSLYTKNGDSGYSSTLKRSGIPKSDILFEVLGSLDELNVALGGCRLVCNRDNKNFIESIQRDVSKIASCVAKEALDDEAYYLARSSYFEEVMDKNPLKLTTFVLPGFSESDYRFHLARVATRRAERKMVLLSKDIEYATFRIYPLLQYLNRLSDLLFMFSVEKQESH
ncbi:ATP:cob(I)alamin adenosyltransferase [Patescibacteria group bacterium]|nr:ATP:cob(I)alamin adenosyltransferase [Patescibacteria group bacterium]